MAPLLLLWPGRLACVLESGIGMSERRFMRLSDDFLGETHGLTVL